MDYVNPFFGSDIFEFKNTDTRASKWFYLKPQIGNLSPAACLPYNALTVVPFNGCYPAGYNIYRASSSSVPRKETKTKRIKGFTHYAVSGTGFIDEFYNYFMTSFTCKGLPLYERVLKESAAPGEYSVETAAFSVTVTLSRDTAFYKVCFRQAKGNRIVLNPAWGGLDLDRPKAQCARELDIHISGTEVQTHSVFSGPELFAYAKFDGCDTVYETAENGVRYVVAELPEGRDEYELKISFSLTNASNAKAYDETSPASFGEALKKAKAAWEAALAIADAGGGEKEKRIFYSCLYAAQKKPVDISHENFLTSSPGLFTDIATMWDMYKTALPFMALFYPEKYAALINGLLSVAEEQNGRFPVCVLLERKFDRCSNQARSLAHSLIMTAYSYKIDGIDYRRALKLMLSDLEEAALAPMRNTHVWDMGDAFAFTAKLAQALGETTIAQRCREKSKMWLDAFDTGEGMLKHGPGVEYYEGTYWNYSFRLSPFIRERIALCGDKKYEALLDRFFGYTRRRVRQFRTPTPDHILGIYAESHPSFEGMNNEPDIETPYNYSFIGRHSRVCEIVRSAMACRYDDTAAGLPGNDDSGALSSWYVFNAAGLFPVAGTEYFLIGSPVMEKTVLRLRNDFTVLTHGNGGDSIYVKAAKLNGKDITRAYLRHEELAAGGTLELFMTAVPTDTLDCEELQL